MLVLSIIGKCQKVKSGAKKPPSLETIEDDNGNKIYYMDRKKTDKRVYSAGMRKSTPIPIPIFYYY